MLDALIISDVHLGSSNCCAKELCNLLQEIEDGSIGVKKLIINGDLFDSLEFRRLKKKHWKILSLIRSLSDKINVVWVKGNHDEGAIDILSHLIGTDICEQYVLDSGDKKILIIHGDLFDKFITKHPNLTWLADCFYHFVQKIDFTNKLASLMKRKSKIFLRCTKIIEEKSIEYAKRKGCDEVCVGHTHFAVNKTLYHNSGSWVELPPTYLIIRDGKVDLKHYLTS